MVHNRIDHPRAIVFVGDEYRPVLLASPVKYCSCRCCYIDVLGSGDCIAQPNVAQDLVKIKRPMSYNFCNLELISLG